MSFNPVTTALAAATPHGEKTPLDLDPETTANAAGGGSLVRTVVGLAIVLAVIYGLHWVLKQVKSSREETASGNGLRQVASLPLGPNRALHVVRAGDEVLVLGSAEGGVTAVRAYSEDEAIALGLIGGGEPGPVLARPTPGLRSSPRGQLALPAPKQALEQLRAWTVRG